MDKLRAMALLAAAVESGSFSAAGRRFGLSPASVSRQIAELEAHLETTLVHRSTRNLGLSEAGQAYVRQVESILGSIEAAEAEMTAMQSAPRGVLRVHSRTMFGTVILARLQHTFSQRYPEVTVELHLSERPVRLREEGFDLDFRIAPPQESGLMRKRLFLSERVLVASPDYLSRAGRIGRPEDLLAHKCLVYWLNADPIYWRFMKGEAIRELQVPIAFASNNGLVLLEAALAGHGIALLDNYTVSADIAAGRLKRILRNYKATNTTFEEGIFATFLAAVQMPAKQRAYLDFVISHWKLPLREETGGVA